MRNTESGRGNGRRRYVKAIRLDKDTMIGLVANMWVNLMFFHGEERHQGPSYMEDDLWQVGLGLSASVQASSFDVRLMGHGPAATESNHEDYRLFFKNVKGEE